MTEPTKEAVPPGWGRDELTKFLDNVRANQLGTFASMRGAFDRLAEIDRAFTAILQESRNPRTELVAMLFLRCHSAFRAASGLALAGHAVESNAVNRTALEFAGYALHMFRNPAVTEDLARPKPKPIQGQRIERRFLTRENPRVDHCGKPSRGGAI
jgi:hypothetical protein